MSIFRVVLFVVPFVLAGCSAHKTIHSGVYSFEGVATPTRLVVRGWGKAYWVDLALMTPEETTCKEHSTAQCEWLEDSLDGATVLISRQYDRYGLSMHSVWVLNDEGRSDELSISLQAVAQGYLEGDKIDYYNLPKPLGENLVAARAYRESKKNLLEKRGDLKPWMVRKINNLGAKDE